MPSMSLFKAVFAAMALLCAARLPAGEAKVLVEYFFQPGCHECELVRSLVLPGVEERFAGFYELKSFDIGDKESFLRLAAYQDSLQIKGNEPVTMVVQGRVALSGYKSIKEGLGDAIDEAMCRRSAGPPPGPPEVREGILKRRAEMMTLAAVALAGLLDGVNPCAFSTLVFFMSLLAVAKVRAGKLLAVGAAYCAASFLTYAALGFGIFRSLRTLEAYPALQRGFNLGMAAVLVVLAALSFRDAFRYRRGRRPEDVSLRLPVRVKGLMHSIMKSGLGYRWLVPGAFAAGAAVTLLESVCTGQTYIPALTLLAKESPNPAVWVSMILLYNLMFIIPLLCVFAAAYFGTGMTRLLEWSRRDVVPAKALLGLLFLALAALILLL